MVEIEMEVDIAPHYGTEVRLDDDLIDYDAEAEGEDYDENQDFFPDESLQADENDNGEQQIQEDMVSFQGGDPRATDHFQIENHVLEKTSADRESSHEIDYDVEDASDLKAVDVPSAAGEQDVAGGSSIEDTLERTEAEDQEISWENEHDLEEKPEPSMEEGDPSPEANSQGDVKLSSVYTASETVGLQSNKQEIRTRSQSPEESGFGHDSVHEDSADDDLDAYEILDGETDQGDEPNCGSRQFPAITVQYKGDEFPCFSAESDGFFSQLSLLDESIKSLLEGFREELTNELVADDELVFQVDELGLEFSESSSSELLDSITFRQIIELFDVLVKNQDPDNNRSLYTYLFTRPSTGRRLDFLMESAAQGKGLDEVIHLFQSPLPHTHGADTGDDSAGEDAETQFDEVESADDDGTTEANHVSDTLDSNAQIDEGDTNGSEVIDQSELVSGSSPKISSENPQVDEEIAASGAFAAEDDVGNGEVEQELPSEASRLTPFLPDASDGKIVRAGELEETATGELSEIGLERGEADDILGIDFDEPVDLTTMNGTDEDRDEVEQEDTQIDNMQAGMNDASTTTTTLKDDADILSASAGFDTMDDGTDELIAQDEADQEVEGEIDWRDNPETETLLDDVGGDTLSLTTKRTRCEEENGAGEDQNAKRRRP